MNGPRWTLPLIALLGGCATGDAATARGKFTVDTLPDGTPRTMTEIPVGWSDTNGWKLVEVARITGGTDAPGELVDPQSVAIDGAGRIYVTDRSPAALKQYEADGTFLRTIASEGRGPGEFKVGFITVQGPHIFLQDPSETHLSVFDTSGTFLRSWISFCCYWMDPIRDTAGNVGVAGPPPRTAQQGDHNPYSRTIRWFRADSTAVDSMFVPAEQEGKYWSVKSGRNSMSTDIPWTPHLFHAILPDHRVILGTSGQYLLAVTRENGADTVALFGRQWTPLPISDDARKAEVERRVQGSLQSWDERALRNAFLLSDVPTTAPAFDGIGVDGAGDIWIRTPLPEDSTRVLFDIFDAQYRWLGQVSGSRFLGAFRIGFFGDKMVGQGEDEAGNPVVVVYKIERGGE